MTPQQDKAQKLLAFLEKCEDNDMITPVPPKVIIEVLKELMGDSDGDNICDIEGCECKYSAFRWRESGIIVYVCAGHLRDERESLYAPLKQRAIDREANRDPKTGALRALNAEET